MVHPKRKQSKQERRREERMIKRFQLQYSMSNCGAMHIYHTICGECGYYRGKLAIEKNC